MKRVIDVPPGSYTGYLISTGEAADAELPGGGICYGQYNRDARKRLVALLRRAAHLSDRTEKDPCLSYDRAELTALLWAFDFIVAVCGPLPEDLARLRATIT